MEIVLTFKQSKITPGTHMYLEPPQPNGQRPAVGRLYVTKTALAPLGYPDEIEVTIRAKVKTSDVVREFGSNG